MSKLFELFPVRGYTRPGPNLFGIECEIESLRSAESSPWTVTEDGSLRNSGREFISAPITLEEAVNGFKTLHSVLTFQNSAEAFTERTSIHVHVNCQPLEQRWIQNIIYMYALYEEFFFRMASPDRRHNIHCVPLTETHLPSVYRMSLVNMIERWHKYTALNIKPLTKYGTLEFRHMHGHNDAVLFEEWLKILDNLFKVATTDVGYINRHSISNANLERWFDLIFGGSRVSSLKPLLKEMTYNQRLDIKLMLTAAGN